MLPAEGDAGTQVASVEHNSNNVDGSTNLVACDAPSAVAAVTAEEQGVVVPLTPTWMKHRHQQAVPRRRSLAVPLQHHHHRGTAPVTTTPESPRSGGHQSCGLLGTVASNPIANRDLPTTEDEATTVNGAAERSLIHIINQ